MVTVLKTAAFQAPPLRTAANSQKYPIPICVSFRLHHRISAAKFSSQSTSLMFAGVPSPRSVKFLHFVSTEETETTETQEAIQELQIEDSSNGAVEVEEGATDDDTASEEEAPTSVILALLQSYKRALASNDDAMVAEIEAFLKSVEDEKIDLEGQVANLSEELSTEDCIIRISADFDNFRKRTEKERLSLVTNAQGEVLERLFQV